MANISGWIAFPVIIALYVGQWLDRRFGTEPWLFLATITLAFLVSMFGLATTVTQEFKIMDRANQKSKDKQTKELK